MFRRRLQSRLWVRPLEQRAVPAVFTVTNVNDTGAGSIQQAILDANGAAGADSIVFDATVFANPQTILLNSGEMAIAGAVTITGPTAKLTINAGKATRIFNVDVPGESGQPITISNLTLVNGNASGSGGGISNADEALSITNVTITGCTATFSGGGLSLASAPGSLTLTDCVLADNLAILSSSSGGAVSAYTSASVTLTRCTLANNTAGRSGGGIMIFTADNNLTIIDCTISGNKANTISTSRGGGGLHLYGNITTIRNSTISGNSAYRGGGIYAGSMTTLTVQNSTIAFNGASNTGGGVNNSGNATITFTSSIIGKNITAVAGPDVSGAASADFSLIGSTSGATITGTNNFINVDPLLGPLTNNGGPTLTHLPQSTSPCINVGSNPSNLTNDQRGPSFSRIQGLTDIGAVEVPSLQPSVIAANTPTAVLGAAAHMITVTFSDNQTGINISSLATGNLTVTGPSGFTTTPTFVSVDNPTNGTPRTATYSFTPPGGAWDDADYGVYKITTVANSIFDIDTPTAHSVPAGMVGTFQVALISVTNTNDSGAGSLRQAVVNANSASFPLADTIAFAPSIVSAGDATIGLTSFDAGLDTAGAGPSALLITSPITIIGPSGDNGITINRSVAANFRLFHVRTGGSLTLENLTLSGGTAVGFGGGGAAGGAAGMGGAIFSQGTLTIRNSTLMENGARGGNGGSVQNTGGGGGLGAIGGSGQGTNGGAPNGGKGAIPVFPFSQSPSPGGFGGGGGSGWHAQIGNHRGYSGADGGFGGGGGSGGSSDSLANGSAAPGNAGGFGGGGGSGGLSFGAFPPPDMGSGGFGGATATQGSGGGGAGMGGAIFSTDGSVTIVNSTIANNSSVRGGGGIGAQGLGGAIFSRNGSLTITSSTLANNSAAQGGGAVFVVGDSTTASLTMFSTILANSATTATDFQSATINGASLSFSGSANLIKNNAASPNGFTGGIVSSADPMLAPLANNGGPILTFALLPGSPAINAGSNSANLSYDQRGIGFARVIGSAADVGAFEFQPAARTQSVQINDGTAQRSRVTSIAITFDQTVTLPANPATAFQLKRSSDNAVVSLSATIVGNTVTLTFTGGTVDANSLADGRYTLTALAGQINNGNFDGNGDGTPGDDYVLIGSPANGLFRLFGDSNGDATVATNDLLQFRLAFGGTSNMFDFDNDGSVSANDFIQFRLRFGGSI